MSNMLNCTEQVQIQKYKTLADKTLKHHVSKQPCPNIQLSSKDGLKEKKLKGKLYVPISIKHKNHINVHISNPDHAE